MSLLQLTVEEIKIPSEMRVGPHYRLRSLVTLLTWFDTVDMVDSVETVDTDDTVQTIPTVLHCYNSSMYAYVYCQERLERYWNGLLQNEQKVGVDGW